MLVGPPCAQGTMWWDSHQAAGKVHPGIAQPPSRATSARRWAAENSRFPTATSSTSESVPSTTGMISALQSIRRSIDAPAGPE